MKITFGVHAGKQVDDLTEEEQRSLLEWVKSVDSPHPSKAQEFKRLGVALLRSMRDREQSAPTTQSITFNRIHADVTHVVTYIGDTVESTFVRDGDHWVKREPEPDPEQHEPEPPTPLTNVKDVVLRAFQIQGVQPNGFTMRAASRLLTQIVESGCGTYDDALDVAAYCRQKFIDGDRFTPYLNLLHIWALDRFGPLLAAAHAPKPR